MLENNSLRQKRKKNRKRQAINIEKSRVHLCNDTFDESGRMGASTLCPIGQYVMRASKQREIALASSLSSIALIHFDSLNRKWN